MNIKRLCLTLMVMLVSTIAASAQLLNYDFTVTGFTDEGNVNVPYSGELIGLQDNSTSLPSEVILNSNGVGIATPLSFSTYQLQGSGFTLSNGTLTQAQFGITPIINGQYDENVLLDLEYNPSAPSPSFSVSRLINFATGESTFGETLTLTLDTGIAVPEPSEYLLLITGLTALAGVRRFLKIA